MGTSGTKPTKIIQNNPNRRNSSNKLKIEDSIKSPDPVEDEQNENILHINKESSFFFSKKVIN